MKKKTLILLILSAFSFVYVLSLVNAQSGYAHVTFSTAPIYCNSSASKAEWVNSSTGQIFPVDGVTIDCKEFSAESGIPSCCPAGNTCNLSNGAWKCIDDSRITDCSKYTTERTCNDDDVNVGISSVANSSTCGISAYFVRYGESCVNQTRCKCVWESNSCKARKSYTVECPSSGTITIGNCTWGSFSVENEECLDSSRPITVKSIAKWTDGTEVNALAKAECQNISTTYSCVSTAKLPFFNFYSFFVSSASIALIYFLLSRKK